MGEVITLDVPTLNDIPVERILDAAKEAGLERVMVIGETESGELYVAASSGHVATNGWLLELAKAELLEFARSPE